ncbi:MAG: elongation factor G [Bacillus sp. (in: firmicutes)]
MGKEIRNVVLLGHQGSGKTMIAEALSYISCCSDRFGHIEEGNTISDYSEEEKNRRISIQTSLIPLLYGTYKVNLLDSPGYLEFEGERVQALQAADAAILTVSARSGIKVGTERGFEAAKTAKLPITFLINKIDKENSDYKKVYNGLRTKFGPNVIALQIPVVKNGIVDGIIDVMDGHYSKYDFARNQTITTNIPAAYEEEYQDAYKTLMEVISESSEEYLMMYLERGFLTEQEMAGGLHAGLLAGEIYPVLYTAAQTGKGIQLLLDYICESLPSPFERTFEFTDAAGGQQTGMVSEEGTAAVVFKTIADPFVGKLSFVKVLKGSLDVNSALYNANRGVEEKINHLYTVRGKEQRAVDSIRTGDIGLIAKLQSSSTYDTLCNQSALMKVQVGHCEPPTFERVVVVPKKSDEDKVLAGLIKIQEEDPSIIVRRDNEFLELRISGMGETHLEIIKHKLADKFDITIDFALPHIPYRETINGRADVQGRFKKQSGGHGQFGDVTILFEPRRDGEDGLLFINKIVGGAIPKQYIPAVEKGLCESMGKGVLAGFPLIRLQATLHDGSYHTVDSSEYAFKVAAAIAYKEGIAHAEPCILEPILKVEMDVPTDTIGDIMSELTRKRGRILGMEEIKNMEHIVAEVPQAEMLSFTTELKSWTSGRGRFTSEFSGYEELAADLAANIMKQHERI